MEHTARLRPAASFYGVEFCKSTWCTDKPAHGICFAFALHVQYSTINLEISAITTIQFGTISKMIFFSMYMYIYIHIAENYTF